MNSSTDSSLILRKLSTTEGARGVFNDILNNNQDGRDAITALRDDPAAALALLNRPEQLGLTLRNTADVVEAIVGEIQNPAEARSLVEENLITSRRAELLTARGDLPSVLSEIVSASDIHVAILNDLIDEPETTDLDASTEEARIASTPATQSADEEEEGDELSSTDEIPTSVSTDEDDDEGQDLPLITSFKSADLHKLRPWAHKLKDRSDYRDILELKLDDDITIGIALVLVTGFDHDPKEDLDLFRGTLLELGIDHEDDDIHKMIVRASRVTYNPIHIDDLIALRKELINASNDADPTPNAQDLTEVASALI